MYVVQSVCGEPLPMVNGPDNVYSCPRTLLCGCKNQDCSAEVELLKFVLIAMFISTPVLAL